MSGSVTLTHMEAHAIATLLEDQGVGSVWTDKLRDEAGPTEPNSPSARVTDSDGDTWVWCGDGWAIVGKTHISWEAVLGNEVVDITGRGE